jgi:hypothetical protein
LTSHKTRFHEVIAGDANMSDETAEPEIVAAFSHAIAVARRLRPRGLTSEVAAEYVRETTPAFLLAGITAAEAIQYSERIWLSVAAEAQA